MRHKKRTELGGSWRHGVGRLPSRRPVSDLLKEGYCQTAYVPQDPYYNNSYSPSFRQILDMGDLPGGLASFPPGQSGQVGSPHYDDLARPWLEGRYCTVLWTREAVEAACGDKMILESPKE